MIVTVPTSELKGPVTLTKMLFRPNETEGVLADIP